MAEAKSGDTVRVHYTGTLPNGEVFDSSEGHEPLEFTLGEGTVIPGFDDAVTGMSEGQEKTVTIPSGEAYGPRRDEMLLRVPRGEFPPDLEPQVGQQLQMAQGEHVFVVTIREVQGDTVVLDANHPLAGEDLTFKLHLVQVS
jgi:peptidylprolyl isomerase